VIVHIDAFGNLITSLQPEALMPGSSWELHTAEGHGRLRVRAGRAYADVSRGELVAYVGSAGLVEIAVREGSAAQVTGLGRGAPLRLGRPSS
jgi:S-adenosylmethionine hydrolase